MKITIDLNKNNNDDDIITFDVDTQYINKIELPSYIKQHKDSKNIHMYLLLNIHLVYLRGFAAF